MTAERRRGASLFGVAAVCTALIGCGVGRHFVERHSGGLADRCADYMAAAFPSADIRVTKREAADAGIDTIVANVEGVRRDLQKNSVLAHDLAVECRFTDDVLTGFRWTKGPLH